MSAINSNSSERDFEAIHRAQRAHEPSMEEILASIRNIIADDPAKRTAPKAPQPVPTPASTPQIVYSKDTAAPQRVDFGRDDAFIAPLALARALSVATSAARKAAI
jgi:hypothetical protein